MKLFKHKKNDRKESIKTKAEQATVVSSTSQNITHSTLICNTSHLNLLKFNELFYGSAVFLCSFLFFSCIYIGNVSVKPAFFCICFISDM